MVIAVPAKRPFAVVDAADIDTLDKPAPKQPTRGVWVRKSWQRKDWRHSTSVHNYTLIENEISFSSQVFLRIIFGLSVVC
jgi:hypothetical protein